MLVVRPEMDGSGWDIAHAIVDGRAPAPLADLNARLLGPGGDEDLARAAVTRTRPAVARRGRSGLSVSCP